MSRRLATSRRDVCQLCDFLLPRKPPLQSLGRPSINSYRAFTTTRRSHAPKTPTPVVKGIHKPSANGASHPPKPRHVSQAELEAVWKDVKTSCNALLSKEGPPTEEETIRVLSQCNSLVELLVLEAPSDTTDNKDGATLALLSLDESKVKRIPTDKLPAATQRTMDDLSKLAYSIVKHPPVFISPAVLEIYTKIQANLGKPHTFPEIFHLYANKPIAQEGSSPVTYSIQNPNKIANAINPAVATRALQTAIDAKQLVVAMDIIDATFTTTAFLRAKFVRKCLLPAVGIAAAPLAAYTVATQLAGLQDTMEPVMATNVAFAGILAYTFFTGTIGVVALTTANDQMDRVTWAPGMPLRERWIREEERAAIDKLAVSWGFHETWRRGEEEGEDWDLLREWIGHKGMLLDRVELMEGME